MFKTDEITTRLGSARMDAKWTEDPNTGNLHITTYPSKPGILTYQYRLDDGSTHEVRELVTEKVLHNAEVLKSLEDKSLLNEHKFDANGQGIMITSANAKDHSSGWTKGEHVVAADGKRTRMDAVVSDESLINLIKSGKGQVSPGYQAKTSGVGGVHPIYGRYDTEQTWRGYNHLSVTWKGRSGDPDIGIRVDSENNKYHERFDAWEIQSEANNNKEIHDMDKITIGEHEVEVSKEAAMAFKSYQTRVDSDTQALNQTIEGLNSEKENLTGKVTALESDLQAHEQLRLDSQLKELQDSALIVLGKDFKLDGLDAKGIKEAVVKAKYADAITEGMSADRLDGMYDIAMLAKPEQKQTRTDSFNRAGDVLDGMKPQDLDPVATARQKQIEEMTKGRA